MIEYLKAFAVGGALCVIGQILIDKTKLTPARILVGYVVAGVILSGCGIYKSLLDFAGAGASIPLTGFGHCLAEGVKSAIEEKGFLGILTGGLQATAGGISAAILEEDGIYILDFKTDRIQDSNRDELIHTYSAQVRVYARAMARIFEKKVLQASLYFFRTGEFVQIEL